MGKTSLFLILLTLSLLGPVPSSQAQPAASPGYPCEDDLLEVMFAPESKIRLRDGVLSDLATDATADVARLLESVAWHRWSRISHVPETKLDEIRLLGEKNRGRPLYDLNNILRLQVPKGHDIREFGTRLESLPGVLLARPVPKPMFPPLPADHQPQQNYLDPAASTPTGVDAEYAWTRPGGTGLGVTVCDLEYFWNYDHADLTKAVGSQINVNVADPGYGPAHGTAVIGELVADDNGWGVTGICHGASLKTCGTYFGTPYPTWNVPGALTVAIANLQPGDVILLEQQWDYSGFEDYGPIEWWSNYYPDPQSFNAVYAAIETAVALGIHVVETGGNGEGDTDMVTWYGDSGAIIVGAGGAYPGGTWIEGDLQKLPFTTYGTRFDLQGWGEDVVTTGYGDLYSSEGPNYFFTSVFSGTSSAGPMVAGAVASCVGFWKANISPTPPAPSLVRSVLKSTGTPQITPPVGNIGPRPDLRAAFAALGLSDVPGEGPPLARVVLEQNYPNPLNPETRISFSIPTAGEATLTVHDIRGRLVARLAEGWHDPGEYEVTWRGQNQDGASVASGMYLVKLEAAGEVRVIKATLVK